MMPHVVSEIELGDASSSTSVSRRLFKFSAVGAGGMIVQGATLAVLLRLTGMHYLAATALAVEAAITKQ